MAGLIPLSDSWGGAWGAVSAWGGSWGWSWGPLHEVEDPVYYGGGRRETKAFREQLFREHWDYLDALKAIQVQVADDARGSVTVSIPVDMPLPEEIAARAMRGNVGAVTSPTVSNILDDPMALAMLALLIADESDY